MSEETKQAIELYERLLESQQKVIESLTNVIHHPFILVQDEKGKVTKEINLLEEFRKGLS